jgi:hypothetical protein
LEVIYFRELWFVETGCAMAVVAGTDPFCGNGVVDVIELGGSAMVCSGGSFRSRSFGG